MSIRFRFDEDRVIPVPDGLSTQQQQDDWREQAASDFLARWADTKRTVHPHLVEHLDGVLAGAVERARDGRSVAVVLDPEQGFAGQLNILYTPDAVADPVVNDFLAPARSRVYPNPHLVDSEGLGAGVSTTSIQPGEGDGEGEGAAKDAGFRRWFFPGENGSVAAFLGPVNPYTLAFLQEPAHELLVTTTIDGFTAASGTKTVQELVERLTHRMEEWQP
ncbi:hypothetical protein [Microbacterium sp. YY-01]|uniref:hypothetical protein n=1 Tax=Microbacterium sp. YY-01 TaxID=3421634 RepID=UPI003D180A1F